jgi:UDP-glucose 4-epimerase
VQSSPRTSAADPGTMAVIGYGFIGRRIGLMARARGWGVRALNLAPVDDEGVEVVVGAAQDVAAIQAVLRGATHVVYAAGTAKPADSNLDPVSDAVRNLEPLLAVLSAMRSSTVTGFTYLSSGGAVYGPDAPVPTPEDAPLWPISSYGIMKLAAERYVAMYARDVGFAADLLRCANAYGPGEPTSGSQGLIGIARANLLAGRPVTVFGDGTDRRDYIHVDDVAEVVVRLAEQPDGVRVINVGSGRATSISEIVRALSVELGVEADVDHRPARPTDAAVTELDITRLRSILDVAPRALAVPPPTGPST